LFINFHRTLDLKVVDGAEQYYQYNLNRVPCSTCLMSVKLLKSKNEPWFFKIIHKLLDN